MNKEDKVDLVLWCKTCGLVALLKNNEGTCVYCQGPIQEIGWVER